MRIKSELKTLAGFFLILLPSTLILSGDMTWTLAGLAYSVALQHALGTREGKKYMKRVMESIKRI